MHTPAAGPHEPEASFPPAPWHLTGTMTVSLFTVPLTHVPHLAQALPLDHALVRLGRNAVVGLAVARYEPGGDLAYDELLIAVLTRRGLTLRATVTQIWVDSPASRAGGRALWAIPKELATSHRRATDLPADQTAFRLPDGAPILRLDRHAGRRLTPGRVPIPVATAQRDGSATVTAHNTVTATVRTARARWQVAVDGPLGWLAGRRPLGAVTLTDARLTFGARVDRRK